MHDCVWSQSWSMLTHEIQCLFIMPFKIPAWGLLTLLLFCQHPLSLNSTYQLLWYTCWLFLSTHLRQPPAASRAFLSETDGQVNALLGHLAAPWMDLSLPGKSSSTDITHPQVMDCVGWVDRETKRVLSVALFRYFAATLFPKPMKDLTWCLLSTSVFITRFTCS